MTVVGKRAFDPLAFLTQAGVGRVVSTYARNQQIFSQGEPADAVFYLVSGKCKVSVVSSLGREAVVESRHRRHQLLSVRAV